jgi:hypothetical protein
MSNRIIKKGGLVFYIGNRTPRRNEYEKGLKYIVFVGDIPTSNYFNTIKAAKQWINENYWMYL